MNLKNRLLKLEQIEQTNNNAEYQIIQWIEDIAIYEDNTYSKIELYNQFPFLLDYDNIIHIRQK